MWDGRRGGHACTHALGINFKTFELSGGKKDACSFVGCCETVLIDIVFGSCWCGQDDDDALLRREQTGVFLFVVVHILYTK